MEKLKKIVKPFLVTAVILIAWQLAFQSGYWSTYVLPSPAKVWNAFWKMVQSGVMARHVLVSLQRVLKGFGVAFTLAFILALAASAKQGIAEYYGFLIEWMKNVPPLSLIALLILWFGIGEKSKIIIIVLASFFPMFLNIKKGFSCCDEKLLEVGRAYGFSPFRCFARIILPNAVPDILVGMRIGLGYSWRAIIGAEMIAAGSGLGYLILDAQQMSRSDKIMVGIFVIGMIGLLCDKAFSLLMRLFLHGGGGDGWY